MKGLFIVTIVIAHLVMLDSTGGRAGATPTIVLMLYLGLLVFYVIAGYFYKPERTFGQNMRRVLKLAATVAIASFLLPAIIYCWFLITGQAVTLQDLGDSILKSLWLFRLFEPIDGPLGHQMCFVAFVNYFLWPMVEGLIVFFALEKHVMCNKWRIVAVIIVALLLQVLATAVYIRLPFYLHLCPIAVALMFVGASLSKIHLLERTAEFRWREPLYWAPFVISFAAAYILCTVFPGGLMFDYLRFGPWGEWSVFTYFLQAVCMSVVYAYVAVIFSKIPLLSSFLSLSGRHSLCLALCHIFFVKLMTAPFFRYTLDTWFPAGLSTMDLLIISMIDIAVCLVLSEFGMRKLKDILGGSRDPRSRSAVP